MDKFNNQRGLAPILIIVGVIIALVTVLYIKNNNQSASNGNKLDNLDSAQVTPTISAASPAPTTKNTPVKSTPTSTPKPNTPSATSTPVQAQPTSGPTVTPQPPTPTPVPPVICNINIDKSNGPAPLTVTFVYSASYIQSDGYVTNVQWDFNGDGNWDTPYDTSSQHPAPYTFSSSGNYTPRMHLQTQGGRESSVCTTSITVN